MPMILAMNGAPFFGELGAVSQSIADLQTALVALGKGIGDKILSKIVVDGIMGPKTAAATNRALTVHLGSGQAPASLRTGSLSQSVITSQASTITQLIETEVRRRGFTVPISKRVTTRPRVVAKTTRPKVTVAPTPIPTAVYATPAAPAAVAPIYRVPAPAGMDLGAVMKWTAIGLGVIIVGGLAYYLTTRRRFAMAGLGELPKHDLDTLEALVDKEGSVLDVIEGLSQIAFEKGDHLRSNWQDEPAAKRWDRLGKRLDNFAYSLRSKGYVP